MESDIPVNVEMLMPKAIKVVLTLDMSGSMDREKRTEVQKNAYMIAKSLEKFKDEVGLADKLVETQTDFIGFGSTSIHLPENPGGDEFVDFNRSILDIGRDLGGTEDAKALGMAEEMFTEDDIARIQTGELVAIILEVTDGETGTADLSKQILKRINDKGIFCRAVQIPGGITKEMTKKEQQKALEEGRTLHELIPPSGTFADVWKEKGLRIDSIGQLKGILSKLLEEAMESSFK